MSKNDRKSIKKVDAEDEKKIETPVEQTESVITEPEIVESEPINTEPANEPTYDEPALAELIVQKYVFCFVFGLALSLRELSP